MLHFILDFTENEEDSRKLKKVQELVQHFSEQCRHVPSYNINIHENLMNYEAEKREEEKLCR